MVKEVAADLFMITQTSRGGLIRFSVNIFVIAGVDGLIFDSGYGSRKENDNLTAQIKLIEKEMKNKGRECNITRILPSHGHWDHFSGIAKIRKKLGVSVLATKRMLKSIVSKKKYFESFHDETELINLPSTPFRQYLDKGAKYILNELIMLILGIDFVNEPVRVIEENSLIIIDKKPWEVIFSPGHCNDAVVLYNRNQGILLCGDNILRSVTTWLGPPKSDLKSYISSLEFFLTLPNLKLILPSHGSPVTQPLKRIKDAIRHRNKKTEEILKTISQTGKAGISFNEIFKKFYPKVKFHEKHILRGWILITLEYLLEEKKIFVVIEEKTKKFRTYAPT